MIFKQCVLQLTFHGVVSRGENQRVPMQNFHDTYCIAVHELLNKLQDNYQQYIMMYVTKEEKKSPLNIFIDFTDFDKQNKKYTKKCTESWPNNTNTH